MSRLLSKFFLCLVLLLCLLVLPTSVLAAPDVTSITPDEGPEAGGTAVNVAGTGFEQPFDPSNLISSGADNEATAVTTDADGNVYVTGAFWETLTIQGSTVTGHASDYNVFVAKFDSAGTLLWLKSGGGSSGSDYGKVVEIDGSGNVVVGGNCNGSVTFGALNGSGGTYNNVFVIKYDSNGNEVWLTVNDGSESEVVNDLAFDTAGNIYVTGRYDGTTTFGGVPVTNANTDFSHDVFLLKYTSGGAFVFVRSGGGTASEVGYAIAVDSAGGIYITGLAESSTVTFGALSDTNDDGQRQAFILKYDATGTPEWFKMTDQTTVESNGNYGTGLAIDSSDMLYFGGSILGTSTFGGGGSTFGTTGLTRSIIIQYDTAGNEQWYKEGTSTDHAFAEQLALGRDGALYQTGYYETDYTVQGDTITAGIGSFITKYDLSGNLLEIDGGSTTSDIYTWDVAADADGNAYTVGIYWDDLTFGSTTSNTPGGLGLFLAQFSLLTPEITFDGTDCSDVNYVSAISLTCTTPAHAAGPVDVVVTNSDTTSDTLVGGFTYTGGAPAPSPTPTPTPSPTPTPTPTPTPNPSPVTAGAAHIGGPADDAVLNTNLPTFSWTAPAQPENVSSYQIIINGTSFFGDLPKESKETADYILVYDSSNNSFLLQSKKEFEPGTYTWKIASKSTTGQTTETGERTFSIGGGTDDTTTGGVSEEEVATDTDTEREDVSTTSGLLSSESDDSSAAAGLSRPESDESNTGGGGAIQGLFSSLSLPSFPVITEATQATLTPLEPVAPVAPIALSIAVPVAVAVAAAAQVGTAAASPSIFVKIFQALGLFNYGTPQGLVFDSLTHAPVPFALLTIASQDKNIQETSVTDVHGVYKGVKLPPGTYTIQVGHQEFAFPSRKQRPGYVMPQDFYVGGPFTVKSAKTEQLFLIPMDNRGGALKAVSFSTRLKHLAMWAVKNQTAIATFFFIFSALMTILTPTIINIILTVLYGLLLAYKLVGVLRQPLAAGLVLDAKRKPISKAILKFVRPEVNQLAAVVMSDVDGSYEAFVEPGNYQMMVVKPGYVWNENGSPLSFNEVKLTQPKKMNVTLQSQQDVYDEMLKSAPKVAPSFS